MTPIINSHMTAFLVFMCSAPLATLSQSINALKQHKYLQIENFEPCNPCNEYSRVKNCGMFVENQSTSSLIFSECNKSMPCNPEGVQQPAEGRCYGGFAALRSSKNTTDVRGSKYVFLNREYIIVKLATPLKKNEDYTISFYLSLAEQSSFASPSISIAISKNLLQQVNKYDGALKSNKSFKIKDKSLLSDSISWRKISLNIKANGDESYLTIGALEDDIIRKTYDTINSESKNRLCGAYYYIDSIKIEGI